MISRRAPYLLLYLSATLLGGLQIADAADAAADALQRRIVEQARTVSPDDFSFTRTARTETIQGAKTEQRTVVERFDPAKPAAQRWTLVTVDGRAPNADELKQHAQEAPKRRVAHYGRIADYLGSGATAATDARGRTVFRFPSLPKDSVVVMGSDISLNAAGEATVDVSGATPFVEQTRFTLTKPARVKLIAKIEKFEASTRYRMMPNGKPVPVEQTSDAHGSMMGKQGRIKSTLTYSDHQPAGR